MLLYELTWPALTSNARKPFRPKTDFNIAIEFLNRALKMTPNDPLALFNRAIVYERMHFHGQAIEDWHYLRVDPNSKWAAEARQRLADAEQAGKKTN